MTATNERGGKTNGKLFGIVCDYTIFFLLIMIGCFWNNVQTQISSYSFSWLNGGNWVVWMVMLLLAVTRAYGVCPKLGNN